MNFVEIIKRAQALADEDEQYQLHVRYKQEICSIAGIPPTGAIPQTLTPMQTARLVMPDSEKKQKIIAWSLNEKYGYRAIYNDDQELTGLLTELATELNIILPDIVHWWLNGARPRYATCPQVQAIHTAMNQGNTLAISEFLNRPKRVDDWFEAIYDSVRAFYGKHGEMPNETQAWLELWTNPPKGYAITTGVDKGEDCLNMPGKKALSLSAFKKRWKNYTTNNSQ